MPLLRTAACFFLLLVQAAVPSHAEPADSAAPDASLPMSPELRQLLQAEMRELQTGAQTIAACLPAADWDCITKAATGMRESYILEKKLTKAQEDELARLPDQFKALDQGFHLRAGRLQRAAIARDAEGISFQFSRLLDTCVACHTSFARAQFPNFGPVADEGHRH